MFTAHICTDVIIAGCPEAGLAALDWRRAHGFTDRMDNRIPVEVKGEITETDFRALVGAGWRFSTDHRLIARPGVTAPIASATSAAQVDSLIRSVSLKLSAADIGELDEASA